MLSLRSVPYKLHFRQAAGTSRAVLYDKESWFVIAENNGIQGIGECSLIPGLSPDNRETIEAELDWLCRNPNAFDTWKADKGTQFPAVVFGMETALSDLVHGGNRSFGQTAFTKGEKGIPINGLIWMGKPDFMRKQIEEKLAEGFDCIKIKIGAIAFEEELDLLRLIRKQFDANTIEIRVDANGAFGVDEATEKLKRLSEFHIQSIEQPIRQGQAEVMARLCQTSPIPIALDEELIGIYGLKAQQHLLNTIQPHYIILKPSLLGGLSSARQWIALAEEHRIGWWATSALESNIGLNAIAQWTFKQNNPMPQGLGTGQLYSNNVDSPLEINKGKLFYNPSLTWTYNKLKL